MLQALYCQKEDEPHSSSPAGFLHFFGAIKLRLAQSMSRQIQKIVKNAMKTPKKEGKYQETGN
jgi:hypothetical protein